MAAGARDSARQTPCCFALDVGTGRWTWRRWPERGLQFIKLFGGYVSVVGDPGSLNLSAGEGAMQPPPRRRYGSPRYNDKSHNADGSNKLTFVGAFGLSDSRVGNTYPLL